jgi:predicted nucleotidyltransferase
MEDVILLGSITNYNWTPYSDVDMHIVADYGSLDMDEDTAQTMFDAIKTNWNSKHDIKMKGYDVELYVQDKDHVAHSASEYSVLRDEWNKEPVKEKPNFNKELIKKKYSEYKKKTENILANKDEKALKDLLEKLYKFRQAGLDKGGELSEENIVFKILRAKGYLDKIKDGVAKIYDKKMSVKETDSQITLSGGGYRLDVQRVANKILDYAKEHGEYPDVNPLFNALVIKYNKNIDDVHDDVNRAFRKLNSILIEKEK